MIMVESLPLKVFPFSLVGTYQNLDPQESQLSGACNSYMYTYFRQNMHIIKAT